MSFDPYGYEREEELDSRRHSMWPDDPDRPDPSEYMDAFISFTRTLDCGHRVSAHEEDGGFDEIPRVTEADVLRLLDFKIATHDCARYEKRLQTARLWAIG